VEPLKRRRFSAANWRELAAALVQHAQENEVGETEQTRQISGGSEQRFGSPQLAPAKWANGVFDWLQVEYGIEEPSNKFLALTELDSNTKGECRRGRMQNEEA
jgi:hypothetical protein